MNIILLIIVVALCLILLISLSCCLGKVIRGTLHACKSTDDIEQAYDGLQEDKDNIMNCQTLSDSSLPTPDSRNVAPPSYSAVTGISDQTQNKVKVCNVNLELFALLRRDKFWSQACLCTV